MKQLDDAEEWLYDEGEDQIKSVYQAKLGSLKVQLELFPREEFSNFPLPNTRVYSIVYLCLPFAPLHVLGGVGKEQDDKKE